MRIDGRSKGTRRASVFRFVTPGRTLLAPIFGSGCLDAAMADSPEGLAVLAAMFEAEQDQIRDGALPSDSYVCVAKPRRSAGTLVREAFERHGGPAPEAARLGIRGGLDAWLELCELTAFETSARGTGWRRSRPRRRAGEPGSGRKHAVPL